MKTVLLVDTPKVLDTSFPRCQEIAVESVETLGGGQHLGQGTGVPVANEAEIVAAENTQVHPENAAEISADDAATRALISACVATGTLRPSPAPRVPPGYVTDPATGSVLPPPDSPMPAAWQPPVVVGGSK